jgi:hypothetical protein
VAYLEDWEPGLVSSPKENLDAQRRLEMKYKNVHIIDTDSTDDKGNVYQGLITCVEYVKGGVDGGRRFEGAWRVDVTELEKQEDGSYGVPEDGGTSTNYEINVELINMIVQSPLNGFLAFQGAAGADEEAGDEEAGDG